MKLRMMKALFLILLFTLSSCGQEAIQELGQTRVVFTREDGTRVTLNKGVIIYAHHLGRAKSTTFFGSSLADIPTNVFLPNGQYLFYAGGFHNNSVGEPMSTSSSRYCSIANNGQPINLNGGLVEITLTLSQTNACPSIFGPVAFRDPTNIKPLQNTLCTGNQLQSNCRPAGADDYQIILFNHRDLVNGPNEIGISNCLLSNTGAIPLINTFYGPEFKMGIRKWSGTSCTGTPGPMIIIGDITNLPGFTDNVNFAVDNTSGSQTDLRINKNLL